MSHSKEQETIVLKVLSYKPHQFYEILQVSKADSDTEIKKSYRKLAIKLHPDKNPHPRASEAFKYLNKAWGVLSDPGKKKIFDQTGSDPDARFGAGGGSSASASGRSPFGPGGANVFETGNGAFEDDIFNFFFGNGATGAGPNPQTFSFGNNGFTFQSFGGPGGPGFSTRPRQRTRPNPSANRPQEDPGLLTTFKQLLPLLLFILVPLLSSLFSESNVPDYSFYKTREFNTQRSTPSYNIPFYVSEKFLNKKKLSVQQLRNFDSKVENLYIQDKRSKCSREQIMKNDLIDDAQGWFSTNQQKLKKAQNLPMPNCEALRNLNLI